MNRILSLVAACCLSATAFATHIVGGDISLQFVSQDVPGSTSTYDLTVRVYRDCNPGSAGMPNSVTVGFYDMVTNQQLYNFPISNPSVTTIAFGDSCYTPTTLCVDEGVFTTQITIAFNPNGYYVHTQLYARNNIIDNISGPGSTGMSFYAEIPDPSIINSTPDFGAYPQDGYLCVNNSKDLIYNITDSDGDSLVYSLVDPLDCATAAPSSNGTFAKPYPSVVWQPPYSLADIVGGAPPMSINTATGIVTCAPNLVGEYVFAVRVEEYRNSVKIGETRRDFQYAALNCTFDQAPAFYAFGDTSGTNLDTVVNFPVGVETCFDIIVEDLDLSDTIYMELLSLTIDNEGATFDTTFNGNYGYWNTGTAQIDSAALPGMLWNGVQWFQEGTVATRYCWTPTCQHVQANYWEVNAESYSLGCSGSDTAKMTAYVNVVPPPDATPQFLIRLNTERNTYVLNEVCFDIIAMDPDATDTMFVEVHSNETFQQGATVEAPADDYTWYNDALLQWETVNIPASTQLGFSHYMGVGEVGIHYCWTPLCDHLDPIYDVDLEAYSIGYCGDTTTTTHSLTIDVWEAIRDFQKVPNVFTPNGDGVNDYFEIEGIVEPCFDFLTVKIFNRWGQMVYESFDPDFRWDGRKQGNLKDCASGTYFVLIYGARDEDMDGDDEGPGKPGYFANDFTNLEPQRYTVTLIRGVE